MSDQQPRIDHAVTAQRGLDALTDMNLLQKLGYDGFAANIAVAQTHATLAVVEQLRIANLIAYKQLHTGRKMRRNPRTDDWEVDHLPIGRDNITDEIDRVLDLAHLNDTDA